MISTLYHYVKFCSIAQMACISDNMNRRFPPSLETIAETLLHPVMTAIIKQTVKVRTYHHTTPTCSEV